MNIVALIVGYVVIILGGVLALLVALSMTHQIWLDRRRIDWAHPFKKGGQGDAD
jgi:hypothetical protein